MDPTRPRFPGFMGFQLSSSPIKSVSGCQLSRGFPSHKNTFPTLPTNILTFRSRAAIRASNSKKQEREGEREREMCRLGTVESGLRLQRMKNGCIETIKLTDSEVE